MLIRILVRVVIVLGLTRIYLIFRGNIYFFEIDLLSLCNKEVEIVFFFDWISIRFIFIVGLISSMILGYSKYYIEGEIYYYRFIVILLLFVFSIWLFVLSPNVISLLLGWDGLGLTSYLLVIYYQRDSSNNAGMLTVLSNRIGDVCLLIGISILFFIRSWNFLFFENKVSVRIRLILILAGITKRAQLPFSAWLPAAIAAPTPVSSLVHSSTLVTAGVYLIIRFFECLDIRVLRRFLFIVSVRTIFMAGLCANFEIDIKKIIALSTLRQLGLIMIEIRLGFPILAYCHLVTHAIFKSTIFICAGVIIHMGKGRQDIRGLGRLRRSRPLLSIIFRATNLALCGFPFLAGYYSKDIILERRFIRRQRGIISLMIILSTGFTISYSLRVLFMGNSAKINSWVVRGREDVGYNLRVILGIIFILSLVRGFFVLGWMDRLCGFWLLSGREKYYVGLVRVLFVVIGLLFLRKSFFWLRGYPGQMKGLSRIWFCLLVVSKLNIKIRGVLGWVRLYILDKGWYEYFGGLGGQKFFIGVRRILQKNQVSFFLRGYLLRRLFFLVLIGFIFCLVSL